MNQRTPSLTISKKSIKLSKSCRERFTKHTHIEILYHPVLQVIAFRGCSADTPNAVPLMKADGKPTSSITTNAFTSTIYEKMEWIQRYQFRFRGISRERGQQQIMFFFLDEPQILLPKKDRERAELDDSDSNVRYIPYKEQSDIRISDDNIFHVAYPEKWGGHRIGISYGLREQRNKLFSGMTEYDLGIEGTAVQNPLIGYIPDRYEVEDELEQLLLMM